MEKEKPPGPCFHFRQQDTSSKDIGSKHGYPLEMYKEVGNFIRPKYFIIVYYMNTETDIRIAAIPIRTANKRLR